MQYDEFESIIDDDGHDETLNTDGCGVLIGLNIIAKYLPDSGIGAASHDQIFACGVDELLVAGLTREDAIILSEQNWMIDEESLSSFV